VSGRPSSKGFRSPEHARRLRDDERARAEHADREHRVARRACAGKPDAQRDNTRSTEQRGDAARRQPRELVVDERELQRDADGGRDGERVEHRQVRGVRGVNGGPCGMPKCEHTTRAGRCPAFA
jgi:hypothetical protein